MPGSGKHRVLPPISSETDRQFLQRLDGFIATELTRLGCPNQGPDEQRYTVYKDAFDQIIEHVSAYKPLLTSVKAEYEDCIEAIKRGQKEAFYLSGKVKTMASEQTTLSNYRKRGDELEDKIRVVKEDTARITSELEYIKELRRQRNQKDDDDLKDVPKKKVIKRENKQLPGLTIEESTDIAVLNRHLLYLEQQVKDLILNKKTKFASKEKKHDIKEQLNGKMFTRDEVTEKNEKLKKRNVRLKVAVDAVHTYNKEKPSNQSLVDCVDVAFTRPTSKMSSFSHETYSTFEDDDPSKEKEAEAMLDYIEGFNELFEEEKYTEAALHAANSPKGILRNPGTLTRFKGLPVVPGHPSPLLIYCEALMATVTSADMKPSAEISWECVECALLEDRLDLVMHWIAQDRLTYCLELGHLLSDYSKDKDPTTTNQCLAMAQTVYSRLEEHRLVALCMLRQRRIHALIEYTQKKAKFMSDDYLGLLEECPTVELAMLLGKPNDAGESIAPVEEVVVTLIRSQQCHVGLGLLEHVHAQFPSGNNIASLKTLVFNPDSSLDTWKEIVTCCQENGYLDIGIELLAAVTVRGAVTKAMETTLGLDDDFENCSYIN
ncbi:clathrin heavy chain linker domain-containing protein 1-like [Saccoglossus kowalevskii]|uniref:Clathrin heavy chain linker domain-containing protein 1-like n=1 Tax=Saccoglossus kowalevskii TaxID=10224 RepID=A0ABM0GM11_SACKO|nr:PREDICTED: clathrin heavy chain linker domain-containing protein 1-like [Saccoglossus kowalevskii]